MTQDKINQNEWGKQENWSAMVYRSSLDNRLFVPKRIGFGVTVNFGHSKYGKWLFVILGIIITLGVLGSAVALFVLIKYGLKR